MNNNQDNNANTISVNNNPNTNTNITPITITPITPQVNNTEIENNSIPPINNPEIVTPQAVTTNNDTQQSAPINEINNNLITPNIIIPETKNDNNNQNLNIPSINNEPQLNLESSSPFDIGITHQINNPQQNQTTVTTPTGENQKSVAVNANNNTTSDNNMKSQDINIAPPDNASANNNLISTKTYMINILLFSIPIIGLILLIIKSFDKKNSNISNLAKAFLIYEIIIIILSLIIPTFLHNI